MTPLQMSFNCFSTFIQSLSSRSSGSSSHSHMQPHLRHQHKLTFIPANQNTSTYQKKPFSYLLLPWLQTSSFITSRRDRPWLRASSFSKMKRTSSVHFASHVNIYTTKSTLQFSILRKIKNANMHCASYNF